MATKILVSLWTLHTLLPTHVEIVFLQALRALRFPRDNVPTPPYLLKAVKLYLLSPDGQQSAMNASAYCKGETSVTFPKPHRLHTQLAAEARATSTEILTRGCEDETHA